MMEDMHVNANLLNYLEMCRIIYRADFDFLRSRRNHGGEENKGVRAIMSELDSIHEHRELQNERPFEIPEEFLIIHSFE